jgi:hypothetical protein
VKTALTAVLSIAILALLASAYPATRAQNLSNDTENWDINGFGLTVNRSKSLSDLIFSWKCRPPKRYDAFNVRAYPPRYPSLRAHCCGLISRSFSTPNRAASLSSAATTKSLSTSPLPPKARKRSSLSPRPQRMAPQN